MRAIYGVFALTAGLLSACGQADEVSNRADAGATNKVNERSASTLDGVLAKGFVQCGVSQGLTGFSNPDDQGNWTGLDIDFCRAVAAAIFGDAEKVRHTPLSAKERFTALQSGEIDVLPRNTTFTMSRDTNLGIDFIGVNFYDGQGLMVRKSSELTSGKELSGATICTNSGTTTELNIADFFRTNGMTYEMVSFEKSDEAAAAYDSGRCDVYTTDVSGLYADRVKMQNPDEHIILPEVISKEPLGPCVRQGDAKWTDLVRWTHFAMLIAEELGVNSQNVDDMLQSSNPEVLRLLGKEGVFGESLGLKRDWAYQIIKNVGNYGESFERNVGSGSLLKIDRGLNRLWSEGGLHYAPPIR
jgi:general L-amino acid transport system substrate-binding protein